MGSEVLEESFLLEEEDEASQENIPIKYQVDKRWLITNIHNNNPIWDMSSRLYMDKSTNDQI